MVKKVKIGWIGAGFVGQVAHLENFTKFNDVEIMSLAEKRPNLRKKVGSSYNITNLYENHKQLIKNCNSDAIVAIVNRRHTFEVAKDVLQAGFNLFTEKPMAQNINDALELVKLAEENSLIYSVGFMKRYDLGIQRAKEILNSSRYKKKLGKIISVRASLEAGNDYCNICERVKSNEPRPKTSQKRIAPEWVEYDYRTQYENFVNVASHKINLLTFLFDQIPEVKYVDYRPTAMSYAFLNYKKFPALLEWGLFLSDSNGMKEGIEIRFENGELNIQIPPGFLRNVSAKLTLRIDQKGKAAGVQERKIISDYIWSFENSARGFINAVKTRKQSDHAGKSVVKDFEIIDSIWQIICSQKK